MLSTHFVYLKHFKFAHFNAFSANKYSRNQQSRILFLHTAVVL